LFFLEFILLVYSFRNQYIGLFSLLVGILLLDATLAAFLTLISWFWPSFVLVLLTSAIIARLLSRGPDSLSESRKRGCVMATAEKSEQRLPVFLFAVFSRIYSNFYVLSTHCVIFWLFWGVF